MSRCLCNGPRSFIRNSTIFAKHSPSVYNARIMGDWTRNAGSKTRKSLIQKPPVCSRFSSRPESSISRLSWACGGQHCFGSSLLCPATKDCVRGCLRPLRDRLDQDRSAQGQEPPQVPSQVDWIWTHARRLLHRHETSFAGGVGVAPDLSIGSRHDLDPVKGGLLRLRLGTSPPRSMGARHGLGGQADQGHGRGALDVRSKLGKAGR